MRLILLVLGLLLPVVAYADDGEALYRSHCAPCHGTAGRGDGPDAELLAAKPTDLASGMLAPYDVDAIVAKIQQGRELPIALNPKAFASRAHETESLIAFLQRMPSIDWEEVEAGEVLYTVRCSDCHGRTGTPGAGLPQGVARPADLSDPAFQRRTSDAELAQAVRHGRSHMPALVPRVSEDDARLLAAYVRVFSPGYTSYERYCLSCHGRDGRGVGTLGEEIPLPTTVFDAAYFQRTDPEVLRSRAWHMAQEHESRMPHYRFRLTDAQARAVAAHVKRHFGAATPAKSAR
jgi:mono/diheme cytochrome c family protein